MDQGGDANFNGIIFQNREDGRKQRKRYTSLLNRAIVPTRYADDSCLRTLAIYDSVHWMLNRFVYHIFLHKKTPLMLDPP